MAGQAQRPHVIELMVECELDHVVVIIDVVVRFAQKGRARHAAPFVVGRDHATVEGGGVPDEFGFHQQAGIGVQLPTEGRRDKNPLALYVIAKTVVVFDGQIDPREQVALVIQRRVDVQRGAVAVPTARTGLQGSERFALGFFGHDIDCAAWIATAIETGGRAFEHFDTLDVCGVRRGRVAAVGTETVLVELGSGEAADAVLVKGQAAEIVLLGNATGKVQRTLDTVAAQILEHRSRHYADRLRDVPDSAIGFGSGGRAGGPIALNRAGGGLVLIVGGDVDASQLDGLRLFCRIAIATPNPDCQACQRRDFTRRHVRLPDSYRYNITSPLRIISVCCSAGCDSLYR